MSYTSSTLPDSPLVYHCGSSGRGADLAFSTSVFTAVSASLKLRKKFISFTLMPKCVLRVRCDASFFVHGPLYSSRPEALAKAADCFCLCGLVVFDRIQLSV